MKRTDLSDGAPDGMRPHVASVRRAADDAGIDWANHHAMPLSEQQLLDHAAALAKALQPATSAGPDLPAQLARNEAIIDGTFLAIQEAFQTERTLEPAASWLVDNYNVVKEQLKEIQAGLPRRYLAELPRASLGEGPSEVRVLLLMRDFARHTDGRLVVEQLVAFIERFQQVEILTLGELWAIPLMLRVALVESLAELAGAMASRLRDTADGARWAARLQEVAHEHPAQLVHQLSALALERTDLSPAWVTELHRSLHVGDRSLGMAVLWLEQQLARRDITAQQAIEIESRSQATGQVSVSNIVNSLRLLGRIKWADSVERISVVEQLLRADPLGVHARMDFATRDHYRHAVETLARRSASAEWEVADKVVAYAARQEADEDGDDRRQHVGYWLTGAGAAEFEHALGVRLPLVDRVRVSLLRSPIALYVIPVAVLTLMVAQGAWPALRQYDWLHAAVVMLAILIASSHFAVAVVNWLFTLGLPPRALPRLDLDEGVPDELRTLVAVPCLFSSRREIDELVDALEIRYLANRDANLHLALLADFTDAPSATTEADAALLQHARELVESLNARHEPGAGRFALFIRDRRHNPAEGVWMGYERKRGKLGELNRWLRGASPFGFHLVVGDAERLRSVRFVITLDADTQLPTRSASRMIATLGHPLNRPRYDHDCQRVVEGYAVLQPRVSVGASRETASVFARLHSDEIGLDPYTHLVSDVYQDLLGEGSYVGKGIYDVDAFERSAGRRFPDNQILSHDLIEGSFARAGLVSDVELLEQQPDSYATEARRRHRWTRGDWQLLYWLAPWTPGPRGRPIRNRLAASHRWKILDNLRRSLVAPSLLVVFLDGWLSGGRPGFWTAFGLGVVFAPPLLLSLQYLLDRNPRMDLRLHLQLNHEATLRRLHQALLTLAVLPFEAQQNLDAAARALWRTFVSRRLLLQWTPSSAAARSAPRSLGDYYRMMWAAPATSVLAALLLAPGPLAATLIASPLLLLWIASPWVAWRISQPVPRTPDVVLGDREQALLGRVARLTWYFYERFVTAEDRHLPPDNHQEFPAEQTAHRTSPTNIGMYLLGALSARDFGYLGDDELLDRVSATLDTMEGMVRYRGHFLNWYDTRSLTVLPPAYVSTVDSGNLLGCLLVLARGLETLDEEPLIPARLWRGLRDTCDVCIHVATQGQEQGQSSTARWLGELESLRDELAQEPERDAPLPGQLARFRSVAVRVDIAVTAAIAHGADPHTREWLERLHVQCSEWDAALAARLPFGSADAPNCSLQEWARQGREQASDHTAPVESFLSWHGALMHRASVLASRCRALCEVDYEFLMSPSERLLAIGYNLELQERDANSYDMLASEARLASFVAIAQGKMPPEHWFALGRLMTIASGQPSLLSWSGSMFEYLMPLLVMPSFENTLLTRSCRAAVNTQIAYGRERGVPWGISESGYNTTDAAFAYQYRAFGVPGLGLKRGLAQDLVVAPYATALAALLRPELAARNMAELESMGALGRYGLYEAIDFTPARVPAAARFALVRSWMAHHQGMVLTALSAVLNGNPLQKRFVDEPMFAANLLLLQERIPAGLTMEVATLRAEEIVMKPEGIGGQAAEHIHRLDTPVPQMQLLSNGRYHVALSQAGGGFSQWGDIAVNTWAGDGTRDADGIFCYVQDLDRGLLWSNTWQPTVAPPTDYCATFAQGSAEFRRTDHGIVIRTRVAVSAEDDVELRQIVVTNRSGARRRLALCSYLEPVLSRRSDGLAHPAFNKLFVQTEFDARLGALLARRRSRASEELPPTMFHLFTNRVDGSLPSYESRRECFTGRGGTSAAPVALASLSPLQGGIGSVLDPVLALRHEIELAPGESASFDLVVGIAASQGGAIAMAERYVDRTIATRVFDLAWTREQVISQQLSIAPGELRLFSRIASSVIHADPLLRTRHMPSATPLEGQSGLWKHGISGDLPIVMTRIGSDTDLPVIRQLLRAHHYWQMHGVHADLVVINEDHSGYRQELHDRLMALVGNSPEGPALDRPGGVFLRRAEHVSSEDRALIESVARIVVDPRRGTLAEQFPPIASKRASLGGRISPPTGGRAAPVDPQAPARPSELALWNGLGGYTADGSEYQVWLGAGMQTPMPWVNVLANPRFGSVISESGSAYTWHGNAHEFRLTPWLNDPVSDGSGELFYLRDESSKVYWSPAPAPVAGPSPYLVAHGLGYTRFETSQFGIASEMTVFVADEAPLKFVLLRLRNPGTALRKLAIFAHVQWVLGDQVSRHASHVRTRFDPSSGSIFAANHFNDTFAGRTAFLSFDGDGSAALQGVSATGDRSAFLGRNGKARDPLALHRAGLTPIFGPGLDAGATYQIAISLQPGASTELVFGLGCGADAAEAQQLASTFSLAGARREYERARAAWKQRLGRIVIQTPEPAMDALLNGWLPYQVIASRIWGRSGFYQSGGAYGFRDQLQDSIGLLSVDPSFARAQILLCASRQFTDGDVQHWWHPPSGRGVRTRFSDDLLWLPWAVARYLEVTGDTDVLDEEREFLEGRPLGAGEESYYDLPAVSTERGSLYEHCRRALLRSLDWGEHGLPLIGAGDWNDGMNRLGLHGRGESVWLGFFLLDVLRGFSAVAALHGDAATQTMCRDKAEALAAHIDAQAWDGSWYLRAWNDDGIAIGSAQSPECQIDSLPQSWAALTGVGSVQRRATALANARDRLFRQPEQVIQLFDPPFDQWELDPGYIKGYIPGVRENGGQYTHAAVWLGMAFAQMGDVEEAWRVARAINPVLRTADRDGLDRYRAEPYVVAADVYWASGHRGRGGWSWYTGSAAWMYRFVLETLLGLRVRQGLLSLEPKVPSSWPGFRIQYLHQGTAYTIEAVREAEGALEAARASEAANSHAAPPRYELDGRLLPEGTAGIELVDDGATHRLVVRYASRSRAVEAGTLAPRKDAVTQ